VAIGQAAIACVGFNPKVALNLISTDEMLTMKTRRIQSAQGRGTSWL